MTGPAITTDRAAGALVAADVLRYAFSQGPGRDFVAPLGPPGRPLPTPDGTLPPTGRTDDRLPWVWGSVDLLEDTPYPGAVAGGARPAVERLEHALVMAFGLQRRDPSNLFN